MDQPLLIVGFLAVCALVLFVWLPREQRKHPERFHTFDEDDR